MQRQGLRGPARGSHNERLPGADAPHVILVGRGALANHTAHDLRAITPEVTRLNRVDRLSDNTTDPVRRLAFEGATVVIVTEPFLPGVGTRLAFAYRVRKFAHQYASFVRTARDLGANRLVTCSTAFLYADDGGVPLGPTSPIDPAGETVAAYAAEHAAELFSSLGGCSVVLRFGWAFGDGDPVAERVIATARKGWRLIDGRPGSWVPTVARADAVTAIVAATKAPPGTYNISDGHPVTQAAIDAVLEEATETSLDPLSEGYWGELGVLFGASRLLADTNFTGLAGWRPAEGGVISYLFQALRNRDT